MTRNSAVCEEKYIQSEKYDAITNGVECFNHRFKELVVASCKIKCIKNQTIWKMFKSHKNNHFFSTVIRWWFTEQQFFWNYNLLSNWWIFLGNCREFTSNDNITRCWLEWFLLQSGIKVFGKKCFINSGEALNSSEMWKKFTF